MTTYTAKPASEVVPGDKVRPLVRMGPAAPRVGSEDYPWEVARVQPLNAQGRVRIWAHPWASKRSVMSPANYGQFEHDDQIEVVTA